MIIKIADCKLKTEYGDFAEYLFYDGKKEIIVLTMGNLDALLNPLLRIHSHCISGHIFNSIECDCKWQMMYSQQLMKDEGIGIIIWLDQEGRGNGHFAKMLSQSYKDKGYSQAEAYNLCGFNEDSRSYETAVKVLSYFNIKSVRLITDHERKKEQLEKYGIVISEVINTPHINE